MSDKLTDCWIFAYGSLCNRASRCGTMGTSAALCPASLPASVAPEWGYEADFNVASADGQELYLGLRPSRKKRSRIAGCLFKLAGATQEEKKSALANLRARERYYHLKRIPARHVHPPVAGAVYTFFPKRSRPRSTKRSRRGIRPSRRYLKLLQTAEW